MKMRTSSIRSLFFSVDFIVALASSIITYIFIPEHISISIVNETFEIGITVLSIIFSVYFAALTMVITSGDNKFVQFLEEDGSYSQIIWSFKATLFLLFIALISSIVLFCITLPYQDDLVTTRWWPSIGFAPYILLTLWSLLAAALATLDAIKYAEYRARFTKVIDS